MARRSDLPFGAQFSPSQVDLHQVLQIVVRKAGDREAMREEVLKSFFAKHGASAADMYNRWKLADNTLLAVRAYKLLDEDDQPTDLCKRLASLQGDELYEAFGRHILQELHGFEMLTTVSDMQRAGERVSLESLRKRLGERGIHFPRGGTHASSMKGWLEKAGVIDRGFRIDTHRLEEVLGTSVEAAEEIFDMPLDQRAFLKALATFPVTEPVRAADVAHHAERLYGVAMSEKALPRVVLDNLEAAGFIKQQKATTGRGAKSTLVEPTDLFDAKVVVPLLESLSSSFGRVVRSLATKKLSDILQEMRSADRNVKGKALEALAFYLLRLLDLKFIRWRLRGAATGGAEVDLVLEGARFIFSRWQVQCKNTARVSVDDVAKEVGLAIQLKSNVVMVATTGRIGAESRRFAESIMQTSSLQVILVDGKDLQDLSEAVAPLKIVDILDREAERAMELKAIQL